MSLTFPTRDTDVTVLAGAMQLLFVNDNECTIIATGSQVMVILLLQQKWIIIVYAHCHHM